MSDIYQRLAQYLDALPAGYPPTESGVELRILRKLFTPQEAELFLNLSLIGETPQKVAQRTGQPAEKVEAMLEAMEQKGLIGGSHKPGQAPEYSASQFVVGFWEGQVNRLDRELAEMFEEYLPSLMDMEVWRKAPQLRTIPVGESIPLRAEILAYESAEAILRSKSAIAVQNCICRQEQRLLDHDCGKPLEVCMALGSAAHSLVHTGNGRLISLEEALAILKLADEAGLVLQPANARDPNFICACCGCCCGVLRSLKMHPYPGRIAASAFTAELDAAICSGCGTCLTRCQMGALSMPDGCAELNLDRCIGCGLCVSACDTGALTLVRKPEAEQPAVPKNTVATYLRLIQARGKRKTARLAGLMVKSKIGL